MKKKLVICLCMTMLGLVGCGKESSEADVVLQDDMTTDEAIKYAQQLFAENVDDSEDMDELLDNMFDDAVEDFMGDGASEVEEETDVSVSSETEEKEEETSDEDATKDEQKKVEYTKIDTDYGSYLFAVTGVKMIPSGDGEKVYQISWECENIDFGANHNSCLELPADALVVTDSDGYKVAERSSFQDGETLNREGVVLYSGEKCKAYSVFSINNEACEYLTIGIDTRMDDSMQKVYVEK